MKISATAIVLAAVAGVSAMPMPNGQVLAHPVANNMFGSTDGELANTLQAGGSSGSTRI